MISVNSENWWLNAPFLCSTVSSVKDVPLSSGELWESLTVTSTLISTRSFSSQRCTSLRRVSQAFTSDSLIFAKVAINVRMATSLRSQEFAPCKEISKATGFRIRSFCWRSQPATAMESFRDTATSPWQRPPSLNLASKSASNSLSWLSARCHRARCPESVPARIVKVSERVKLPARPSPLTAYCPLLKPTTERIKSSKASTTSYKIETQTTNLLVHTAAIPAALAAHHIAFLSLVTYQNNN